MDYRGKFTRAELAHYNRILGYAQQVDNIFDTFTKEAVKIASRLTIKPGKIFAFKDYPQTKAQIDLLTRQIASQIMVTVESGIQTEWNAPNAFYDSIVKDIARKRNLPKKVLATFNSRNLEALKAFRGSRGVSDLSPRVWDITQTALNHIELALDIGLGKGTSAQQLARNIKQYLNEPDKLFRRVRDKNGELKLSKAARDYHPGQGVYRSSVKNAQRVTRTVTNASYRMSDYTRRQSLPFVVGIEIKVSHSRKVKAAKTTKSGKPKKGAITGACEMCITLQGKYPKTFKFTGWHPHCFCYSIAIMMTEKEMDDMEDALLEGASVSPGSVNTVHKIPANVSKWWTDNRETLAGRKEMPYFITDNPGFFKNK